MNWTWMNKDCFTFNMIKLSVDETKRSGLLARTLALILYISISNIWFRARIASRTCEKRALILIRTSPHDMKRTDGIDILIVLMPTQHSIASTLAAYRVNDFHILLVIQSCNISNAGIVRTTSKQLPRAATQDCFQQSRTAIVYYTAVFSLSPLNATPH